MNKSEILDFLKHVEVVSPAQCAAADYRVCSTHRNMTGLAEDTCFNCGTTIYYDPRVPIGPKQKLACVLCMVEIGRDL